MSINSVSDLLQSHAKTQFNHNTSPLQKDKFFEQQISSNINQIRNHTRKARTASYVSAGLSWIPFVNIIPSSIARHQIGRAIDFQEIAYQTLSDYGKLSSHYDLIKDNFNNIENLQENVRTATNIGITSNVIATIGGLNPTVTPLTVMYGIGTAGGIASGIYSGYQCGKILSQTREMLDKINKNEAS